MVVDLSAHHCARCGEGGANIAWRTRWWCEECHFIQSLESGGYELFVRNHIKHKSEPRLLGEVRRK